jgi:hypothetical protein
LVAFDGAIYLIFSLLSGLFILNDFVCFHKIGVLLWIVYVLVIISICVDTILLRITTKHWQYSGPEKDKFWGAKGTLWIFLITIYSLIPAFILMHYIRNNKLFELLSMAFSLGFYILWLIGGLLYNPITSLIESKGLK